MATTLKSLSGLAVKGAKANASPGERFVSATLTDERLVIVYSSSRTTTVKRTQRTVTRTRLVTCERAWTDGDYTWLPTGQHILETERHGAPRNRYDWFVPTGKAIIK